MSAEFPRVPRVWSTAVFSPGRFGIVHPDLPWREVMEAYYWDELDIALKLATSVGIGSGAGYLSLLRMIEAEAMTREEASFSQVNEWLAVEVVSELALVDLQTLGQAIFAACQEVSELLEWDSTCKVLVTLMHPAANVPYTPGRDGFFIDKYPYDKICLPTQLLSNRDGFIGAVRHEFAHAMALNRTEGKCPTWLHESIALMAQTKGHWSGHQPANWKSPLELDRAFRHERETQEGAQTVASAYLQSGAIGHTMLKMGNWRKLGQLMDTLFQANFAEGLLQQITGQTPEDHAIRKVYGVSLKSLFEMARKETL